MNAYLSRPRLSARVPQFSAKTLLVPFAVAAALSLNACTDGLKAINNMGTSGAGVTGISSPAPLAKTTIDDQHLRDAWLGYEAAIDAINVARSFGAFPKGSPKAEAFANVNERVLAAFLAAELIATGLSTANPLAALNELRAALVEFRTVIGRK